ncbi:phosphatase PAP2 family protein [Geodermatophilus sp. SYSU D01036]
MTTGATAGAGVRGLRLPRTAGRAPVYRHPGDLLRVGLGLALLGLTVLVARRGELSVYEADVFRLVNDLPALVHGPVWVVMQLGNGLAAVVTAAVAALLRQVRMARDLLVSAVLAGQAATLLKDVVGRERPGGLAVGEVLHGGALGGHGFVSGHSAVAAALATAVAPYLSRRWRRAAWALALAVALARLYVGAHLPLDVVGGLLVGWVTGSLVHYAFGVPRRRPGTARVARLLDRFGLPVRDLRPAEVAARSSHPFTATGPGDRPLFVKVLDPDPLDRDWLYRAARLLVVGDVRDADALAPLAQQAADEGVAMMSARERGVRVPGMVLARGTGGWALVVQDRVDARPLEGLPPLEVTAGLLERVWAQVALLHAARLAHRDLVASSVLVAASGEVWVVDFGNAVTGADDETLGRDVAELMASLALRVDPGTVVDTAIGTLGPGVVAAALPGLEPLALSAATRAGLRADPARLPQLRRVAHSRLGLPDPDRPRLPPAGPLAWALVAAGTATVFVGLEWVAGVTGVLAEVELQGWRWLGGALALAVAARAAAAAAARAAVDRRLAVGRSYVAALVTDGAALVHGRAGARVVAGRYLERAGIPPGTAARAPDPVRAGAVLGAAVVATAAVAAAFADGRLTSWRTPPSWLPLLVVGAAACLATWAGQALARHPGALPVGTEQSPDLRPGAARAATVVGWSAAAVALETAALVAALHGVGGHVPILVTAAVYAALRLGWAVLPWLGAPGIAEVSLVLALTASGERLAQACAGVLFFRLLTCWVPALTGSFAAARFEQRLFL